MIVPGHSINNLESDHDVETVERVRYADLQRKEPSMRYSEVARFLNARKFEPFCIVTSAGENYDVLDRNDAVLAQRTIAVALHTGRGNGVPTGIAQVSLPHITAIEPLPGSKRRGA